MIAVADRGSMLDASTVYYMKKIVTGAEGIGVVDIRKPIGENIARSRRPRASRSPTSPSPCSIARGTSSSSRRSRAAGAGTRLLLDGDVAGGINAARYGTRIDMCAGIGGSRRAS